MRCMRSMASLLVYSISQRTTNQLNYSANIDSTYVPSLDKWFACPAKPYLVSYVSHKIQKCRLLQMFGDASRVHLDSVHGLVRI